MVSQLSPTVLALLRNPETPYQALRDALSEEAVPVNSVWLVVGRCGEYSDRATWTAAAFLDKGLAEAHAEKLNEWCRQHFLHWTNYDTEKYEQLTGKDVWDGVKCPLDSRFHANYTGTDYTVEEVPLGDHQC